MLRDEHLSVREGEGWTRWLNVVSALEEARGSSLDMAEIGEARRRIKKIESDFEAKMLFCRRPNLAQLRKRTLKIRHRLLDLIQSIEDLGESVALLNQVQPGLSQNARELQHRAETLDEPICAALAILNKKKMEQINKVETRREAVIAVATIYRDLTSGSMKVSFDKRPTGKFLTYISAAMNLFGDWSPSTLRNDWDSIRKNLRQDPAWLGRI